MNYGIHVIPEEIFKSMNILPKYMRNMSRIINKVTYIIYKEWSGRALMNEITENNYDVNVLWKENIACLWVLDTDFVLMITNDSDFSSPSDCVRKLISLAFHTYEERRNQRSYASCASIWRQCCPTLRIGNKHGMWMNDLISMIVSVSDFSWPWDWFHWKTYLFSFSCI
jgi:hypothetical protein